MAKTKNDSPAMFMPEAGTSDPALTSFGGRLDFNPPATIPPAKEPAKRKDADPELKSIRRIQAILDELPGDAARCRVMAYLSARHTAAKE